MGSQESADPEALSSKHAYESLINAVRSTVRRAFYPSSHARLAITPVFLSKFLTSRLCKSQRTTIRTHTYGFQHIVQARLRRERRHTAFIFSEGLS